MAEVVNIASLTINVDDVIKESVRLQKEIDKLKASQKDLDRTTEEGAAAYARNEAQLKNLSKSYRDNQNFAAALEATNEDLNKALEVQDKSTQELYDSRRQLNLIAKNIQGNTEEEIALRDQLNEAIDAQTQELRGQQSEYNKNKDRIGEYKDSIIEAVNELRSQQETLVETRDELRQNLKTLGKGTEEYNNMSQALVLVENDLEKVNEQLGESEVSISDMDFSIQGFIKSSEKSGGTFGLLKGGLKAATQGMVSFTKSALAFIATPVGIVLAAIVGAFLLIKNAMNRSEEATAKVRAAFGKFSGIAHRLLKFLQPLGEFLIDGLVAGFELVEKGLFKALKAIQKGLKLLGLDSAAESLGNFTEEIKEAAEAGEELVKAELELNKAQRIARKTQLEFQRDAEKLRQLRDDESKNIQERIKANEDLGRVLRRQSQEELAIAQKALDFAEKRIQLEGETTDALDARAEAEAEIVDIQERITGQTSEQLTNRIALQKEAAEQAIAIQEAELEAYLKGQEVRAKSLEETVEIEREAARQRIEILDNELRNKLITQREYDAQVISIQQDLLKRQAALAVDNAKRELETYIATNQSKLDSDKFLSEQSFKLEKERLNKLAEERRSFEALKLEEGVISQQEFNDAINIINEENRVANQELEKEREEARKEKEAEDFENRLLLLEEQNGREFEVKQIKLDADKAAEIENAEKTGASIALINAKYAQRQKNLDDSIEDAKLEGFQTVLGGFIQAVGEQTAVGKSAAIAETLIATYQSATNAFNSLSSIPVVGVALGTAAAALAVVSGLSNVAKIRSTSTKYSKGDILKGRSHSQGGIPFSISGVPGFEAEGGEAVINKKSTSMFAPLLSAINVAGGGKKFQGGGIAGATTTPAMDIFDYDRLGDTISEANQNLPAPQVDVQEIIEVANEVQVVEDLASE